MITKEFFEPVFNASILFVGDCTADEYDAFLLKKYKLEPDGFAQTKDGVSCRLGIKKKDYEKTLYVVWIRRKDGFYTLIHECLHIVSKIFEDRHIGFNKDNEEMMAYYQDFLFKKMWRLLNKGGETQ